MKMIIKILQEQHFIEGDEYSASLILKADEEHEFRIPLAVHKKQNEFFNMMESLSGIKFRLEQLGNEVKVQNVFWGDPNFESQEVADKYLQERDYGL